MVSGQGRNFIALLQPTKEGDGAITWVKTQPNVVKVTVDAAIFADREEIDFGFVARNSKDELIEARTVIHKMLASPVTAEAMAMKVVLSWISSWRWSQVSLESDCLVVIQAVRSKTPIRSHFGVIVEECRRLLSQSNNIALFFIKRSANMVAHIVATVACFYPDRNFDRDSLPIEVQHCIVMDLDD